MSSVSSLYRRYLIVCSHWSIDTTKSGRDFGVSLRNRIPQLFPKGDLTDLSFDQIKRYDQQIQSLERINKNVYFKSWFSQSSASGLTSDQCKQIISTESLQQINSLKDSGLLDRIVETFGSIQFSRSEPKSESKIEPKTEPKTEKQ